MPTRSSKALAVAATAMLLAAFVSTATNIAVPILEDAFPAASLTTISWVVSGFNVAQVTFMLVGGRLADRVGRRRIFLWGLGVFALGAGLSGVAPTIVLVIIARILQAVGVALMLPSSLAAVLPQFPPERHASVVSLWSAMGVLGAAIAPTVAAGLLQFTTWRVVFLAPIPIVVVAVVVGRSVLADVRPTVAPPPLDVVGATAGTVAVGGLTVGIVQGRSWGWAAPTTVSVFVVAVLAAGAFWWSSRRHPEPLVDFGLLRIPTFTVVTGAGALLSTSTSATWFLYPLFMTEVWEYSFLQVGMAMTPGPLSLVVLAPLAGRAADRWGYHWLLVLGATLATFGTGWMAWRLQPDETYVRAFLPGTMSIGAGMAFMLGPANAAALRDVNQSQLAAANALYNTIRMFGMALGVAITAAIIGDAATGERLPQFRLAWWVMTFAMAGAPIILWLLYPRSPHSQPEAVAAPPSPPGQNRDPAPR